jgi:hypothetical protein
MSGRRALQHPPSPDARRAGLEQADPNSQTEVVEHDYSTISPIALQASRLRQLYALAHHTAITIATLAYGVAR